MKDWCTDLKVDLYKKKISNKNSFNLSKFIFHPFLKAATGKKIKCITNRTKKMNISQLPEKLWTNSLQSGMIFILFSICLLHSNASFCRPPFFMVSSDKNHFISRPTQKQIPLYILPGGRWVQTSKIQSRPSVHSAIYLLFIYQICGRSWQAQQWRVADNRENWASWMFALQTGLERRSPHAHPSTRSAGLFERVLLFLCASISAHADNCFFVPTTENERSSSNKWLVVMKCSWSAHYLHWSGSFILMSNAWFQLLPMFNAHGVNRCESNFLLNPALIHNNNQ